MYYPHFGLKEPPFKITPNTDFFFSGGNRGAVLDALVYAITNGEGIIKVVGEVGSGKTMLCRMLQTILPEKIESIYLANPSVAPEDVLDAIAFELQLKLPKNADRLKVMQILQAHLLKRHAEGRQVVIFVEEAQGMPLATLEEIRLLSNLETKQDKLLQIVLFGQPELDVNLNETHIRQLRERITHSFHLGPLQTKDIGEYLIFRLRAAGYHGPHLFTDAAIKKLSVAAEGLVRRVNILADKALLSAFAENAFQVTPKHVKAAIQDSEFGAKPASDRKYLIFALLIIVLLSMALSYSLWNQQLSSKVVNKVAESKAVVAPVKVLPVKNSAVAVTAADPVAVKSLTDNASAPVVAASVKAVTEHTSGNSVVTSVKPSIQPRAEAAVVKQVPQLPIAVKQKSEPQQSIVATAPVFEVIKSEPEPVKKVADKPIDSTSEVKLSLVDARMEATRSLLQTASPETLSLQIKSLPFSAQFDEAQLKAEFAMTKRQLGQEKLYLYRKKQNGQDFAVILYGTFTTRSEALAALKKLPSNIQSNRPYLRSLGEVNKEIE